MNNVFICGFGDIGQRVAVHYLNKRSHVFALVRSAEKVKAIKAQNITAVLGDLDDTESLQNLPTKDAVVFYFAPPPPQGQIDTRLTNILGAISPDALPEKVVLISTTAVYGDCHGEWITEKSPTQPMTDRGKRRLHGEQSLQQWANQFSVPTVILRVGGIYGPDRLPIERIRKGLPILKEELSPFTNRIHEDDLAQICVAAADRAPAGAIYNVSDGHPGTMSRYFKDIATALNLPQPDEVDMATAKKVLSPGMLSYLQESRRIDNSKLIQELAIQLLYPNFEQGLMECVAAIKNNANT